MVKERYPRFQLALNQLETAIRLFISGADKFSVITLAGAADIIFSQLILRHGEGNFTDFMMQQSSDTRTRQEVGREINDILYINAMKHLDPDDHGYLFFNVEECALGAIWKAIANYNILARKFHPQHHPLIVFFSDWCKKNLDIKKYKAFDDITE